MRLSVTLTFYLSYISLVKENFILLKLLILKYHLFESKNDMASKEDIKKWVLQTNPLELVY